MAFYEKNRVIEGLLIKLPDTATVFIAEITAINLAADYIIDNYNELKLKFIQNTH